MSSGSQISPPVSSPVPSLQAARQRDQPLRRRLRKKRQRGRAVCQASLNRPTPDRPPSGSQMALTRPRGRERRQQIFRSRQPWRSGRARARLATHRVSMNAIFGAAARGTGVGTRYAETSGEAVAMESMMICATQDGGAARQNKFGGGRAGRRGRSGVRQPTVNLDVEPVVYNLSSITDESDPPRLLSPRSRRDPDAPWHVSKSPGPAPRGKTLKVD